MRGSVQRAFKLSKRLPELQLRAQFEAEKMTCRTAHCVDELLIASAGLHEPLAGSARWGPDRVGPQETVLAQFEISSPSRAKPASMEELNVRAEARALHPKPMPFKLHHDSNDLGLDSRRNLRYT